MLALPLILTMVTNWKSYPHDAEKYLKGNENLNLNLE